jgi:hypothetical protein
LRATGVGVVDRSSEGPESDRFAVRDKEGLSGDCERFRGLVIELVEAVVASLQRRIRRRGIRRVDDVGVLRGRELAAGDGAGDGSKASVDGGSGERRSVELFGGEEVSVDDVLDGNEVEEVTVVAHLEDGLTVLVDGDEAGEDLTIAGAIGGKAN